MNSKLNKHDKLSLALHAAVKRELLSDPDRVISIAMRNLERWQQNYSTVPEWISQWTEILDQGVPAVLTVLEGIDERSTLLRSSTPFTGVISQRERKQIMDVFHALDKFSQKYHNALKQLADDDN